jgi:adenylate cyclase
MTKLDKQINDLERANAELRRQLDESLAQQAATAQVLQAISRSTFDLQPVFATIVKTAARLCDADIAGIFSREGEVYRAVANFASTPELTAFLRARPLTASRASVTGRAALEGQVVHISDIAADPEYAVPEMVTLGKIRTMLGVPLLRAGVVVGVISLVRQQVRPFTDRQLALAQTFADQAVIAIENARLMTETQEALDQQTATAEVLGVINAHPGDLAPVFDAMLERATRLCEAHTGHLFRFEDGAFFRLASRGVPEQFDKLFPPDAPVPLIPRSLPARMIETRSVVHVRDQREDESYRLGIPDIVGAVESGILTVLFVPLIKEGDVVGHFAMHRMEVKPFTDKQIALLQNFAAQAVVAMENARLITETREALEQQTATAEVLQVINSSPGDLAPVFEAMLEKALRLCDGAFGAMVTLDDGALHFRAQHNIPQEFLAILQRELAEPRPDTLMGQAVLTKNVVQIADIRTSEAFRQEAALPIAGAELGGIRTMMFVPLIKDGAALGVFTIYRQEVRPFTDKQIALVQNFAAQAVIAMENARLLGELRQRTEEIAELNRNLEARVQEQVEELGRVGRLKRFLAPQLAELIVSQGDEKILESHRREIVVVFCDLRGYTAFTETAEPEEVLDFLREYHGALGPLVAEYEGTLDQFSGDGIMVFFNDPVPIPDPAERAVKMAMAMRETAGALIATWRRRGRDLGFGVGIAQGYATLGQIGFAERAGYTAIGTVCNLAARLCGEAKDRQILVAQRVAAGLDGGIALDEIGALSLKGLTQPVVAFNVVDAGPAATRLRLA